MKPPTEVVITDVALRDGLQNEPRTLTLQAKRELAEGLIRSGIRSLEVGSFVNPSRVPQMADTAQLFAALPRTEGVEYLALVPNLTGLQRATAAHVSRVRVVLSASEGHSRSNTNRSVNDGIKEAAAVLQRCRSDRPDGQGKQIQCSAAIATAFTCPFDGTVPYEQLRRVVAGLVAVGFEEVSLADTLGNANPAQVRSTVARIRDAYPSLRLSLHLHNTYGMALANVQATLEEGVDRYDAALGGIGGCPFAPGAVGNMATEDIVFMLEAMGITTGVDLGSLAQPARQLRAELDRPLDSSVSRALCWVPDDTADHTRQRAGSLRCLHGEPEARAGARRRTVEIRPVRAAGRSVPCECAVAAGWPTNGGSAGTPLEGPSEPAAEGGGAEVPFDCAIRNGLVVMDSAAARADVGIRDGKIDAVAPRLAEPAELELDATGQYVVPGAIDVHTHFATVMGDLGMTADDYESGTRAAAACGVTTIIN